MSERTEYVAQSGFGWPDHVEPPPNVKLWRYVKLPQLVDLLHTQSLYLTRLEHLDDWCEGTLPPATMAAVQSLLAQVISQCGNSEVSAEGQARGISSASRKALHVSCWCEGECESDALWRLYASDQGVALQTTVGRLKPQLPSEMHMGRIRYQDYDTGTVNPGNLFNIGMWKRRQYEFEKEVRLINMYPIADATSPIPRLRIQVDEAIERIVISPYATTWFAETVAVVVRRFGSALPVVHSAMRAGDQAGAPVEAPTLPPS